MTLYLRLGSGQERKKIKYGIYRAPEAMRGTSKNVSYALINTPPKLQFVLIMTYIHPHGVQCPVYRQTIPT